MQITIERETLEDAYAAGWCAAAKWADREDLLADTDSRAYASDRDARLDQVAALAAQPAPAAAQPAEPVAWEVWVPPDSGYLIDSLDDPQYVDDMTNIEGVQVTPLVYAAPAAVPPDERVRVLREALQGLLFGEDAECTMESYAAASRAARAALEATK